ncbi:hypothetical protein T4E_84 [Trichinella pseudospiralis]|uniref:Uncharacterized protein n=1 Tax=Trichinella pseudospiralis TaxID=6337 RepID=A0A0V0XIS5_TRIPS|nr:hypothetical protein T4E_84 [Trichinella pseudospiralis]
MNSENSYWGCRCSDDYFFEINLRYSLQIRIAQFCKRPSENVLNMRLVLAMPPKLCTEAENAQFLWNNAALIERGMFFLSKINPSREIRRKSCTYY